MKQYRPTSIDLTRVMDASGSSKFKDILKQAIESLDPTLLPLQQGLTQSNYVSARPHSAIILGITERTDVVCVKSAIIYTGLIAGCQCADDPSTGDEVNEYCEIMLHINKTSALAEIQLLDD